MPANLDLLEYEEATSLIPDVLSGKKGNDLSSKSHAPAALGNAIMDVSKQVQRSQREDHERTVASDSTFNIKNRRGLFLMLKTDEDFHNKLMDFQEDVVYQREQAQDNIETFLWQRYWRKLIIEEYCSTRGLIVLMQPIVNYYPQFLQYVTRLIARFELKHGPAQLTLTFYCEKLLKLCVHSTNKLMMYLRFYNWLRDAAAKKSLIQIFKSICGSR